MKMIKKTLHIKIASGPRFRCRLTADGVPVRLACNRYGNREGTVHTDRNQVRIRIETVDMLSGPLWLLSEFFFFLISVFGIFDVRHPYDRSGRAVRCSFLVDLDRPEARLQCVALPFTEGGAACSVSSDVRVAEEENRAFTDRAQRRRATAVRVMKILLWAILIVCTAGAVFSSL